MLQFIQFFLRRFQLWTQGFNLFVDFSTDLIQQVMDLSAQIIELRFHLLPVGLLIGHVDRITKSCNCGARKLSSSAEEGNAQPALNEPKELA